MSGDSIYLVLDMQNDLVHEDGASGKTAYGIQARERGIVAKTREAIDRARGSGVPVGFVRVGFSPDYREAPQNSPIFSGARKHGTFQLGQWGTQVHPDLGQQAADYEIIKHRVSPFYSTSLQAILSARGIRRIYCSGISTNAVVQSTVREGHDRDYEMVLIEDCCCALSEKEHEAAVDSLRRFCRVITLADLKF